MLRTSLNFSQTFNQTKGYLMISSPQLDQLLQSNKQLTIQGSSQQNFIYATEQQTYSMQITRTRNTMMIITQDDGVIHQQISDYLSLEKRLPKYQALYQELIQFKAVSQQEYINKKMSFEEIMKTYAFTLDQMSQKFKISQKQIEKFLEYTNCQKITEGLYLSFSKSLLVRLMRSLMIFLNQKRSLMEPFTFQDIAYHYQESMIKIELLKAVSKIFHFTQYKANNPKSNLQELTFKIEVNSIIRFILIDLALSKNIYMNHQFYSLLKDLLPKYLPLDVQIITPIQQIPQIGQYFFQIKKKNHMVHYDALLIQASIKQRLKFMESYKKRYNLGEIKGAMYGVFDINNQEILSEMCNKYFRRYGQQYQIKIITGKV